MTRKKVEKMGNEEEKQGAKTIFVACDTWPCQNSLHTQMLHVICFFFFFCSSIKITSIQIDQHNAIGQMNRYEMHREREWTIEHSTNMSYECCLSFSFVTVPNMCGICTSSTVYTSFMFFLYQQIFGSLALFVVHLVISLQIAALSFNLFLTLSLSVSLCASSLLCSSVFFCM